MELKMTLNDAKKALYKETPTAELIEFYKGRLYYQAKLADGTMVYFHVPVDELGETKFYPDMEAKLLIRYLVL